MRDTKYVLYKPNAHGSWSSVSERGDSAELGNSVFRAPTTQKNKKDKRSRNRYAGPAKIYTTPAPDFGSRLRRAESHHASCALHSASFIPNCCALPGVPCQVCLGPLAYRLSVIRSSWQQHLALRPHLQRHRCRGRRQHPPPPRPPQCWLFPCWAAQGTGPRPTPRA